MHRGVEGNFFALSKDWREVVKGEPLMEREAPKTGATEKSLSKALLLI